MAKRILVIVTLVALAAVAIDIWVLLWGAAKVEFGIWPLASGKELPPGVLPLLGLVAGVSITLIVILPIVWKLRSALRRADPSFAADARSLSDLTAYFDRIALMSGTIAGTVILLLLLAVRDDSLSPLIAAIVLICGTISAMAAVHAFRALGCGESVEFNSYWGGLGGGQGGWRLSPVATLLLTALIFLAATVTVATNRGHPEPTAGAKAGASQAADSDDGDEGGGAADEGAAKEQAPGEDEKPAAAGTDDHKAAAPKSSEAGKAAGGAAK